MSPLDFGILDSERVQKRNREFEIRRGHVFHNLLYREFSILMKHVHVFYLALPLSLPNKYYNLVQELVVYLDGGGSGQRLPKKISKILSLRTSTCDKVVF